MPTIRQQIIDILMVSQCSALELSRELSIPEKDVYTHLEHIRRSVKNLKKNLRVIPFVCLQCNFIFKDRRRLTRPGRCPKCKHSHIQNARFYIP